MTVIIIQPTQKVTQKNSLKLYQINLIVYYLFIVMKNCFSCIRRIRFYFRSKKQNKKWLSFIQSFCSHNSKFQWCELIMQHFEQVRNFTNASQQTLRELKSTNISSEVIKVMRRDYQRKQTPFVLMVDIFTSYCIHKYGDVINNSQLALSKINADTQNFVDFMRSLMVIYYQLEERELIGDDQFFRVTLSNFITQCLFLREEFYNCVIQVTKVVCKEAQDRITFNMQKFNNLPIQDYEISQKYRLDSSTLTHFEAKQTPNLQKPYIGPIKIVKQIIKSRTPIQKTKCIQSLISQVQFSIRKFYQDHKIDDHICLDADNALSILLYILVQSEQSQLLTHLTIIYNFLNKESLEGKLRFCLDALKACLQFLEKGSIKRNRGYNVQEGQISLWINTRSYFQYISNN